MDESTTRAETAAALAVEDEALELSAITTSTTALKGLTPRQLADGTWFHMLLARAAERTVAKQAKRRAVEKLRERFPDLDDPALTEYVVKAGARNAAIIGGVAGAAISLSEVAAIMAFGTPIGIGVIIALLELAILEKQQVRMIFTLADLHGHSLKTNHLGDLGSLYGHVLKAKGASRAAAYSRQGAVMLFRVFGVRFIQRAAVKFCIPVLSVVIGGAMNFWLTRSLGQHSVHRFRRDRRCADRLQTTTLEQEDTRLLLSLLMWVASGDGRVSRKERAFLRKTLEEMVPDAALRAELVTELNQPEESLLEQLHGHPSETFQGLAVELCSLMAVIDGRLDPEEARLLDSLLKQVGESFDEAAFRESYGEFLSDTRRYRRRIIKQQKALVGAQRALEE